MSLSRRLANLGKAIDSATTGHFLSKGDSDGLFETIQYTDLTGRPTVLDSANITSLIDSAYIQLRQTTSGGSGGLDSAAITNLVDSAYVSARSPAAASGFAAYEYNTSAARTTFQDSDVNGNVLSYSANGIIVYYNGVLMPTSDYTATDGSSVVFTTAVDSGGTVTIAKWALASSGGAGGASIAWGGDRGVFGGGHTNVNNIDYLDLTTPGNASDFGDLTVARNYIKGAVSDKTYAVFAGGNSGSYLNTMDYITISTTGNASDFGDMTVGGLYYAGNMSDGTTGFFAGGATTSGSTNQIQKITIASPGNATDHGDLLSANNNIASCCDNTHAILGGDGSQTNVIQTFSMASASNATDFGDLTLGRGNASGVSDNTYAVFAGGAGGGSLVNTIDYVTIQTTGNATDFGDLTVAKQHVGGASNETNGIYAGANTESGTSNTIDKIVIATTGNATDFGDMTRSAYAFGSCSGSPS